MRIVKRSLVIVLGLAGFISSVQAYYFLTDSNRLSQVKGVPAEVQPAPLLSIVDHISVTPRPPETFKFPIDIGEFGPVQPLYAGTLQYPFYCMTETSGLGQPLVDNHKGYGAPVYQLDDNGEKTARIQGYSKDCQAPTRLIYLYRDNNDEKLYRYMPSEPPSDADIARIPFENRTIPEIYRIEQGTINRFLYSITMLVAPGSGRLDSRYWNKRLIYQFEGGVGIGFRQGKLRTRGLINKRLSELRKGYAVITSSGNKTSYTYNMLLAEDTALRVKRQFTALYGEPLYTVGIGGSGGGLAQYLLAQNNSGLIDAAMPLYSYPDMVSQTIYALDCDLLNNYYSNRAPEPKRYFDFELRRDIEGMNALNGFPQRGGYLELVNALLDGRWPHWPDGNTECINGWFGLASFINNPRQGFLRPFFADELVDTVHWSYWEDMQALYGRDPQGFARTTWGNEGVQYGLQALKNRRISVDEFLHLNRHIGSWKSQANMRPESLWAPMGKDMLLWQTSWSRHNITENKQGVSARRSADLQAIEQAYRSGQIFIGKIDIPVLDIRHYLEHKLDMHHLSASFSSRLRMQEFYGHADHQVIWVSHPEYDPVEYGFEMIDRWMSSLLASPTRDVLASKPVELQDACFDIEGEVIAEGKGVWDGEWNARPRGRCSQEYPFFSNARVVSGADWAGSTFKCHLMPVEQALDQGIYGGLDLSAYVDQLNEIFSTGVCNYALGDMGRPHMLGPILAN